MFKQKENLAKQLKVLDEVHILAMDAYKLHQEFLIYEANSIQFYKSGKSLILNDHSSISSEITAKLFHLKENSFANRLFNEEFVASLLKAQDNYLDVFDKVIVQIKIKGFQDYGLEGQMRNEVHTLMNISGLNQVNILMLRRHEKDFIIRKDIKYLGQFRSSIEKVKVDILNNPKFVSAEKRRIGLILERYANSFYQLVDAELLLQGKKSGEGLLNILALKHKQIVTQINKEKLEAEWKEDRIIRNIFLVALSVVIFIFILAFIFSYRLANELSKPLVNLNRYINDFVESKFLNWSKIEERKSEDEISELSDNFYKMANEISQDINFLKRK